MFPLILPCVALLIAGLVIEERSGLLRAGERAPNISAPDGSGGYVGLHDYAGKLNVVLFFYPRDFSPGCTAEVCSFRDHIAEIRALNAVVFGISNDDSSSHHQFSDRHRLPFPLIADADGSISLAYGADRLGGLIPAPKRVTYVIDRHGVIRLAAHNEFTIGRHIEEVLAALRKIEAE